MNANLPAVWSPGLRTTPGYLAVSAALHCGVVDRIGSARDSRGTSFVEGNCNGMGTDDMMWNGLVW